MKLILLRTYCFFIRVYRCLTGEIIWKDGPVLKYVRDIDCVLETTQCNAPLRETIMGGSGVWYLTTSVRGYTGPGWTPMCYNRSEEYNKLKK